MLQKVKNYCFDPTFRFSFEQGKLDIINYIEIVSLEENRISVTSDLGLLVVKGENLAVKRLLDQEVLISGKIKTIEIG